MASRSDETAQAVRQSDDAEAAAGAQALAGQLSKAVAAGMAAPDVAFNTHSQALAGRLVAEERAVKEHLADLEAKRRQIEAEITDLMLTHSMIGHALQAAQRGAK